MAELNVSRFKSMLESLKAELGSYRDGSTESRAPVTLDQQSVGRVSRVDAMQRQAMAQAQERQRAQDLVRVEQALRRVEEGGYGYCLDCDEQIAIRRLEVDPAAALCVRCAGRG